MILCHTKQSLMGQMVVVSRPCKAGHRAELAALENCFQYPLWLAHPCSATETFSVHSMTTRVSSDVEG